MIWRTPMRNIQINKKYFIMLKIERGKAKQIDPQEEEEETIVANGIQA